jgi:hypothetical protein
MYLIYEVSTGVPRVSISSQLLAEANLNDGEAWVELPEDYFPEDDCLVVDGQLVKQAPPAFNVVAYARHLRTGFLAESDWTQAVDNALSAETKAAWAAYRQELRDFPSLDFSEATMKHEVEALLPTPPDPPS